MNGKPLVDDVLATVLLKARDLATQMTHFHTLEKDLRQTSQIKTTNQENHGAVREALLNKGIVPENIPAQKPIQRLEGGE